MGVQQTGGNLAAAFQLLVIGVGIKAVHIPQVFLLDTFYGIAAGQQRNAVQLGCGQIGTAVCKYNK